MSETRAEAYKYPKLFFICANQRLLPREEMEKSFFKEDGYELSYLDHLGQEAKNDFLQHLMEKIIIIADLYPNSFFFININATLFTEDDWLLVIKKITSIATREVNSKINIGVFHELPLLKVKEFEPLLVNPQFLIKLSSRAHANRIAILNAINPLKISKRSVIRLNCLNSWVIIEKDGRKHKGRIYDISKNHVSCDFPIHSQFIDNEIIKSAHLDIEDQKVLILDAIFINARKGEDGKQLCLFYFSDNPVDYIKRGGRPNHHGANVAVIEDLVMDRLKKNTHSRIKKNEDLKHEALIELKRLANTLNHLSSGGVTTKTVKASSVNRFLGDKEIEIVSKP